MKRWTPIAHAVVLFESSNMRMTDVHQMPLAQLHGSRCQYLQTQYKLHAEPDELLS